MASINEKEKDALKIETNSLASQERDPNADFGGLEERQKMEKSLLWKLDCRMTILVVIYILNYVRMMHYECL